MSTTPDAESLYRRGLAVIRDHQAASPVARITYMILCTYLAEGNVSPSRADFARALGRAERTASRAIAELEDKGLIQVDRDRTGRNVYSLPAETAGERPGATGSA